VTEDAWQDGVRWFSRTKAVVVAVDSELGDSFWVVVVKNKNQSRHARVSVSFAPPTMVRLITHNLLACHVKNCTSNNFPLAFNDVQIELREAEFNPDFLRGFLPKIEWSALVGAAREVRKSSFTFITMD